MTTKDNIMIWNILTITKLPEPRKLLYILLAFKTIVGNGNVALKVVILI